MKNKIKSVLRKASDMFYRIIYILFCIFPIKDKIVASSFYGKKYEDSPKYVIEKLHEISPNTACIWIKNDSYTYEVPPYVKTASNKLKTIYEYATARVWIDCHKLPIYLKKRKKQCFIYIDHGGMGMKKAGADLFGVDRRALQMAKNGSFYVSNSKYLTNVYRSGFCFHGKVLECGLPRNDVFFNADLKHEATIKVHEFFDIPLDVNIVMYGPTHRDAGFVFDAYNIDFVHLENALSQRFGGKWKTIVQLHPAEQKQYTNLKDLFGIDLYNGAQYPNSQELILASKAFVSDYSAIMFTAAESGIPVFTFAQDYESFVDRRGMYITLGELPFPIARDNDELVKNVLEYDVDKYTRKWSGFMKEKGLCDKGDASAIVASIIKTFVESKGRVSELDSYKEMIKYE